MPMTPAENAVITGCRGDTSHITASNWRQVFSIAEIFEVEAILAYHLRSGTRRQDLPDECLLDVERIHGASVIQQGLQDAELETVLSALSSISVLVLKGPSISTRYYPPGVRSSRDLDLLILPRDYAGARSALLSLGYGVSDAYDEQLQLRQAKDVPFLRQDESGKTWSVELHWRLTAPPAPAPPPSMLWDSAQRIAYGRGTFLAPSAEHTVLLLALNLRKQRFARLKTVCDIAQVLAIDGERLDWTLLHEQAHRVGYCALLRHSLRLTAELMNSALPILPTCVRKNSMTTHVLRRIAASDAVLSEARPDDAASSLKGLIPFFSLDNLFTSLHLVLCRLTLSPELASYHRSGMTKVYGSRHQYWKDTSRRMLRAADVLTHSASRTEV